MNVNFGLFPPLTQDIRKGRKGKRDRALAYTTRAKLSFGDWLGASGVGLNRFDKYFLD
jgi:methylenetetrahydrofolate--tRNA-(uracil-5-)-methyltransferase